MPRAFPGVNDAAVLTVPNALGLGDVYVLVQTDRVAENKSLRSYCQAKLSRNFVPAQFVALDRIPRSEAGKIQRSELLELAKARLVLS